MSIARRLRTIVPAFAVVATAWLADGAASLVCASAVAAGSDRTEAKARTEATSDDFMDDTATC